MIPARHFDHVVTIWGAQDVRGVDYGDVQRQWSRVPLMESVRVTIQARSERVRAAGPGELVEGEYKAYGSASLNVVEGDVVEIVSGPEASGNPLVPRLLKVASAYKPKNRHTQLVLTDFAGTLDA